MRAVSLTAGRCVLAAALCATAGSVASAGLFCKKDACDEPAAGACRCEECCKPKKRSCLNPSAAPEAGVAFAIPGVVRPGQAVRVNEADVRRAVREAAARQAERESGERDKPSKTSEERLEALESDVQQLKSLMERLTVAVDKLADDHAKK